MQEGAIESIPYYVCSGKGIDGVVCSDLVLLHGPAFLKEDWRSSGSLSLSCAYDDIAVTALDLSVSADYEQLQQVLESVAVEVVGTTTAIASQPIAGGFYGSR